MDLSGGAVDLILIQPAGPVVLRQARAEADGFTSAICCKYQCGRPDQAQVRP